MSGAETKSCPACAEEILAAAKKCKHCGEWLEESTAPQPKSAPPVSSVELDMQAVHEHQEAGDANQSMAPNDLPQAPKPRPQSGRMAITPWEGVRAVSPNQATQPAQSQPLTAAASSQEPPQSQPPTMVPQPRQQPRASEAGAGDSGYGSAIGVGIVGVAAILFFAIVFYRAASVVSLLVLATGDVPSVVNF